VLVAPANLAVVKVELLDPSRPQHLHRLHAGQPCRRVRAIDRRQQQQAVPTNLNGLVDAGVLGLGQPPIVAALAVASGPLGPDLPAQPARRHDRQGFQRSPEGLDDLFQPVQVTDRHTDVGGVGALAPAPLQQATLAQPTRACASAAAQPGHRRAAARGTR
jgi:hypothetical protein